MKAVCKKITAGLCFAVLILSMGFMSTAGRNVTAKPESVLRLHVIAKSDRDTDIGVKNSLGEKIKPYIDSLFCGCDSFDGAKRVAIENKEAIKNEADKILLELGSKERTSVSVENVTYEQRLLDGVIYPKGEYCSLRIIIGEGRGSNMWSVLFSPISDSGIERSGEGDGRVRIKLKFLEWFE